MSPDLSNKILLSQKYTDAFKICHSERTNNTIFTKAKAPGNRYEGNASRGVCFVLVIGRLYKKPC